ncbi:hypothetical protein V1514DRAFT_338424 [Lipomyces japonicus]|uniref:uncharacterized protein n=1 Tax=Lipomyces japonicus TaxID=56871 RepID=UPI0034CDBB2A
MANRTASDHFSHKFFSFFDRNLKGTGTIGYPCLHVVPSELVFHVPSEEASSPEWASSPKVKFESTGSPHSRWYTSALSSPDVCNDTPECKTEDTSSVVSSPSAASSSSAIDVVENIEIVYPPVSYERPEVDTNSKSLEIRLDSDFDRQIRNGASYRSCRDVPFEEVITIRDYGKCRPPHPFTHLIAFALLMAPNHVLEIEGIYQFIMGRFQYFQLCDNKKESGRWKSAVRHNLSYSKSFAKVDPVLNKSSTKTKNRYMWGFSEESWEKQSLLRGHRLSRRGNKKIL